MWFRVTGGARTWTSLVAVLLLSFWPAFAACDLHCNLSRGTACCAPDSSPQARMDAMPGMEAMPGTEQRPNFTVTLLRPEAPSCLHPVCAPFPPLPAQRSPALVYFSPSLEAVSNDVPLLAPATAASAAFVRGPARVFLASPVSLHILARV